MPREKCEVAGMPTNRAHRGRIGLALTALGSIAVNFALVLRLVETPDNRADEGIATGSSFAESAPFRNDAAEPLGPDSLSKLAILLRLEAEHLQGAQEISANYWSAADEFEGAYAAALLDGRAAIRAELVRRLGPAAKEDPSFRALFRPMDPMYSFLTSDQQLAIQALKLERDAALQAAARKAEGAGPAMQPGAMAVDDSEARAIMQRYTAGLESLLDRAALLELQLRDSPIAQQLRASGVGFTESEFRQTYELMAELQQAPAEIDAALAVREQLRNLLGERRFASLWASRDPAFSRLAETADRHGLHEGMALSVYEVMNRFQDRRMQLAQTADRDPDRAARDSLALANDERMAIARLVGDAIADDIVRGRALETYRLFHSTEPTGVRLR
jgi:hypothetical protein